MDRWEGDGGVGLIGLVLVLVILGAMAAIVVASLDNATGPAVPADLLRQATGQTPPPGDVPDRAGPAPIVVGGDANLAACTQDGSTIETAMAAAHAASGEYPVTLEELVAEGFLSELPKARPGITMMPEVVDGRGTGRVLVNGHEYAVGCVMATARR